jgi:lysozyme
VRLSERGAQFIAGFEGFRSTPYWDHDHYSIGHGTRARGTGDGPITRAEARRRLRDAVDATYGRAVDRLPVKLNQNQFDAVTSFVFNLGPGAIDPDTGIGKALRAKQWQRAADEMLGWNMAGGRVLAGLTARRKKERALFLRRPPVAYSDDERHLLKVLRDRGASKTRRTRAAGNLRKQAAEIQRLARAERDGWEKNDRARRYQGIRRALRR